MITDSFQEKHALAVQFDSLNGEPLLVPSLKTIHPGWVLEKNPEYEKLGQHLTEWCNGWWSDPRIRHMLEALDPALWTAFSYPRTSFDKLLTIGKCLAWIFVWDDAIDDGKFTHNIPGSIKYRDETLSFMNSCFDVNTDPLSLTHSDPAIEAFKDFAAEIRSQGNPLTTARFHEEFRLWVIATADCQKEREMPEVPSLEGYLARRSLNVGFYPYIVLLEYAFDISIPNQWWKTNKHMAAIWYESALIAFITNDMVSLAKELTAGQFESWIPLTMYHRHLSVQAAMDSTGQMVRDASAKILKAEKALYAQVDAANLPAVQTFILGIKHIVLCCLQHPYSSKRYLRHGIVQDDGSILFKMDIKSAGTKEVPEVGKEKVRVAKKIRQHRRGKEKKTGKGKSSMDKAGVQKLKGKQKPAHQYSTRLTAAVGVAAAEA